MVLSVSTPKFPITLNLIMPPTVRLIASGSNKEELFYNMRMQMSRSTRRWFFKLVAVTIF
jgi:hypothetical protein